MSELNVWKVPYYTKNPFKSFWKRIKWSIQRIKYGHCEYDVWDLDKYFALSLASALRSFAKSTNCYPARDDMTYESWIKLCEDMAWHCEAIATADYLEPVLQEDIDIVTGFLRKYWNDLWW